MLVIVAVTWNSSLWRRRWCPWGSWPVRPAIWLNWLWVGLKDLAPMNQSHWTWLLTSFFRTHAHPHIHGLMCVQTCIQTHTSLGSDFADPLVKEAIRWECLLVGVASMVGMPWNSLSPCKNRSYLKISICPEGPDSCSLASLCCIPPLAEPLK